MGKTKGACFNRCLARASVHGWSDTAAVYLLRKSNKAFAVILSQIKKLKSVNLTKCGMASHTISSLRAAVLGNAKVHNLAESRGCH